MTKEELIEKQIPKNRTLTMITECMKKNTALPVIEVYFQMTATVNVDNQ